MFFLLIQFYIFLKPEDCPVHPGFEVALLPELQQKVLVFSLFAFDKRGEYFYRFAVIVPVYLVHYLVNAVTTDLFAAAWAVRSACSSEQEP